MYHFPIRPKFKRKALTETLKALVPTKTWEHKERSHIGCVWTLIHSLHEAWSWQSPWPLTFAVCLCMHDVCVTPNLWPFTCMYACSSCPCIWMYLCVCDCSYYIVLHVAQPNPTLASGVDSGYFCFKPLPLAELLLFGKLPSWLLLFVGQPLQEQTRTKCHSQAGKEPRGWAQSEVETQGRGCLCVWKWVLFSPQPDIQNIFKNPELF